VDCSLCLPWNTRRYSGAELTITASQMPVCSASRFALSHLLKFLVPRLDSELLLVLNADTMAQFRMVRLISYIYNVLFSAKPVTAPSV